MENPMQAMEHPVSLVAVMGAEAVVRVIHLMVGLEVMAGRQQAVAVEAGPVKHQAAEQVA